jgi:hypothetical protein
MTIYLHWKEDFLKDEEKHSRGHRHIYTPLNDDVVVRMSGSMGWCKGIVTCGTALLYDC